jgi:hypothetical protein
MAKVGVAGNLTSCNSDVRIPFMPLISVLARTPRPLACQLGLNRSNHVDSCFWGPAMTLTIFGFVLYKYGTSLSQDLNVLHSLLHSKQSST